MLVPPDAIDGESWETRSALGLRPWVHYLPVTTSRYTICQKLRSMVHVVRLFLSVTYFVLAGSVDQRSPGGGQGNGTAK
jgi:hypothetical protein